MLGIMATGGGKSLTFMLPAFCEREMGGGMTVVVVPLIALRQDMMRKCEEVGIGSAEWSGGRGRQPDDARMVLVTPEAALGENFQRLLD